ncbi:MAG: type III PLP-dependent enzyme [Alphaproteobacteria bacterium]|nr:type III PLP-dependent enzyme [Alphaproteobacteria bacterium]
MSTKIVSGQVFKTVDAIIQKFRPDYPVYCIRPHILEKSAKVFLRDFPGNTLYAVKCNPHPEILRALYKAGIRHFDTASLPEIELVHNHCPQSVSYFMHPIKSRSMIARAYTDYHVRSFIVDHFDELEKVFDATGQAKDLNIFVRLQAPPGDGTFYFTVDKFGATTDEAAQLLQKASRKAFKLGLAFHVGSQCLHPSAYVRALGLVDETLKKAKIKLGFLDVGGGFPAGYVGQKTLPLTEYAQAIKTTVRGLPVDKDCTLMCEPGRALVAEGMSIIVQVLLRKGNKIYINDGIYGSLSETVTAKIKLPARLICATPVNKNNEIQPFIVNGCTCDSLDVLPTTLDLPADVREGDWIEIDRVGAYSNALASSFNGFYPEAWTIVEDKPFSSNS